MQKRFLTRVPPSQDLLHDVQVVQSVYPPSTKWKKKTKGRFSNITTTQGPQKKLCHEIYRNSNGGNCPQIERNLKTTAQNIKRRHE